ncbi:MAG: hypothetical protein ABEJ06_01170 [Haloarculaceae archaeon]
MLCSRRAVLGALGSGLLAGCTSNSDPTETSGPDTQTSASTGTTAPTGTATPTATPTATGGAPDGVSADRLFRPVAMRDDYLAGALVGVASVPYLPYWHDLTKSIRRLSPRRDRFLLLSVVFANQGGSFASLPARDALDAWAGGETYGMMTSLYNDGNIEVKPRHVRMPLDAPFTFEDVDLGYTPKSIEAPSRVSYGFLFDVPADEPYLLEWNGEKPVEGSTSPAYLGLAPDARK